MQIKIEQLEDIYKLIKLHIYGFIAENVGSDMLTSSEVEFLKNNGIDVSKLSKNTLLETAFKFGIVSTYLPENKLKNLTFDDLKKILPELKLPLNLVENYALNNIKTRAYSDIKGLGNKIEGNINNILIEHSKTKREVYEKVIKETAERAVENRKSIAQLKSDLGHKTGDWSRDFGRIADYIMHDAFEHGRAEAIKNTYKDETLVYKSVYKGACKHCIKLFLTNGIGSEPIIFKLSDLEKNGSNIGLKTNDWKPTISPIHPWCRCTLHRKPDGYKWNAKTQMYSDVDENWKRKVERKSSGKINFE